jgi:hypothetical protein
MVKTTLLSDEWKIQPVAEVTITVPVMAMTAVMIKTTATVASLVMISPATFCVTAMLTVLSDFLVKIVFSQVIDTLQTH